MKKYSVKKSKPRRLDLHWGKTADKCEIRSVKKNPDKPGFGEYFAFLEELGPIPADRTPSKIYKVRFTL